MTDFRPNRLVIYVHAPNHHCNYSWICIYIYKESVYVTFNLQVKDKHEVHMMHVCMVTTHGVFQLLGGVETKDT